MRTKVAMIGVGCISGIYLENIFTRYPEIELVGVCDLIRARRGGEGEVSVAVNLRDDGGRAARSAGGGYFEPHPSGGAF